MPLQYHECWLKWSDPPSPRFKGKISLNILKKKTNKKTNHEYNELQLPYYNFINLYYLIIHCNWAHYRWSATEFFSNVCIYSIINVWKMLHKMSSMLHYFSVIVKFCFTYQCLAYPYPFYFLLNLIKHCVYFSMIELSTSLGVNNINGKSHLVIPRG